MSENGTDQEKKVAVITGASSGIGRDTAVRFASAGYDVVLVARRRAELEDVARECQQKGAATLIEALDTNDEQAVQNAARRTNDEWGGIDVWVNLAGVYAAGRIDDIPLEDLRRVMDTNFFGYVNGTRAALGVFKGQGFGTVVNVSSVNAAAPQPYGAIYGATKAAVRSFDESVRMELRLDGLSAKIHVCSILPGPVDTNIYRNSANYTGKELLAVEPVYTAQTVSRQILDVAENPRRETFVGRAGFLFALQHKLLPGLYERTTALYTKADVLGKTPASDTSGNLYEPIETHRGVTGGWKGNRISGEVVDRAIGIAAVTLGVAAAVGALLLIKDHDEED